MLRSSGASNAAWSEAAGRGLFWSDEVQALGYARQFPGYTRKYRRAVFNTALRRQWAAITGGCAVRRTLGALRDALVLARTAQALNAASNIGGSAAIAAGLQSCGALNLRIALGPTAVNWQSGLGLGPHLPGQHGRPDREHAARAPAVCSALNQFTFSSAHAAVTENINSLTQAPTYAARGVHDTHVRGLRHQSRADVRSLCRDPHGPGRPVRADAGATVDSRGHRGRRRPRELDHDLPARPPDLASAQSPGAMSGLTAVTALTPVRVSSTATSSAAKFQGSADILAGGTITGFANANGKVTVTVAH